MSAADEQPFLETILAHYHDDGPRLVYADWLEESDNRADVARAEFIRVQIALAELPFEHPRWPALLDRQTELLQQHRASWTANLAGLAVGVEFRRGIPYAASVDASTLIARGAELLRLAPIRRLLVLDAARVMPELIHSPLIASIEELDFCENDLGNGGINLLLRSPHLGALRVLGLGFNSLDDAAVHALANTPALAGLCELVLNDNGQITSDGVAAIADSPFLAGLTRLDLSGNDVNEAGVRALTTSTTLTRLQSLKLAGNNIGDAGLESLANSQLLARLLDYSPRLDLRANSIGVAGARALAKSTLLARIVELDLSENYLGDRGASVLSYTGQMTRLRVLRLGRNQITDAGAQVIVNALSASTTTPALELLEVSGNRLTQKGIEALETLSVARGFTLETSGNVSSPAMPVAIREVVSGLLGNIMETDEVAALRRKISNPTRQT